AHVARDLAAQRLDLVGELLVVLAIDEREQRIADFEAQFVHLERGADRLLGGRGSLLFGLAQGFGVSRRLLALLDQIIGERARTTAERKEGQHRKAWQQRHGGGHDGGHAERLRIAGELVEKRFISRAFNTSLRDEKAG